MLRDGITGFFSPIIPATEDVQRKDTCFKTINHVGRMENVKSNQYGAWIQTSLFAYLDVLRRCVNYRCYVASEEKW